MTGMANAMAYCVLFRAYKLQVETGDQAAVEILKLAALSVLDDCPTEMFPLINFIIDRSLGREADIPYGGAQ